MPVLLYGKIRNKKAPPRIWRKTLKTLIMGHLKVASIVTTKIFKTNKLQALTDNDSFKVYVDWTTVYFLTFKNSLIVAILGFESRTYSIISKSWPIHNIVFGDLTIHTNITYIYYKREYHYFQKRINWPKNWKSRTIKFKRFTIHFCFQFVNKYLLRKNSLRKLCPSKTLIHIGINNLFFTCDRTTS